MRLHFAPQRRPDTCAVGSIYKPVIPNLDDERFHSIARVLADPRRFAILQQVAASPVALPCSALAAQREVTRATISHHLKELIEAGLIGAERDGRVMLLTFHRDLWRAYCNRLVAL